MTTVHTTRPWGSISPFSSNTSQSSSTTKPQTSLQQHPYKTLWQKTHTALGFTKGYNLPLFIIAAGYMLGFCLARIQYLDIGGVFAHNASPGEWYWYRAGHYRVGIAMHLHAITPAGLLMVWQFLPMIRRRAMIVHRVNGYIVISLVMVANAGAFMIMRRSFGGLIPTQMGLGLLGVMTTGAILLAYVNVKRLQIDQHRAWMLRAMVWLGTIISLRIIQKPASAIISMIGSYWVSMSCEEMAFMYGGAFQPVLAQYPNCGTPESLTINASPNPNAIQTAVRADENGAGPEQIAASLRLSFSLALWVALVLHVLGTELYLRLTPAESQRLREVSYEKQRKAGYANPGSAGVVFEKFRDSEPWAPASKV